MRDTALLLAGLFSLRSALSLTLQSSILSGPARADMADGYGNSRW